MTRVQRTVIMVAVLATPLRDVDAMQRAEESCRVTAGTPKRVELSDGRVVSTDVKSVASSGGSVMAVGNLAYVFPRVTTPRTSPIMQDSIFGFVRDAGGAISLVPNPPGIRRPLFPRLAAAPGGAFHALFVTSDDSAEKVEPLSDTASIWYAKYSDAGWSVPQRVALVQKQRLVGASNLNVRAGNLTYAFPFGDTTSPAGIVLMRNLSGTWAFDTLRTEEAPVEVSVIHSPVDGATVVLFTQHGTTAAGELHTEVLFESRFDSAWTRPRRIAGDGLYPVNELRIGTAGDAIVASWISWRWLVASTSRLEWLRTGLEPPVTSLVASGGRTYPFEMVVIDDRYPLWLYRGEPYGSSLALTVASDSTISRLPDLKIPFENPRARATWLDRNRLLVLTMKQGKSPDEPMVASWATILETRCPESERR